MKKIKKNGNWFNSLKNMYKKHEYTKMFSELLLYLNKYPKDNYALFLYASVLYKFERYEEAQVALKKIVECNKNIKNQASLLLAKIYSKQQNNEEAQLLVNKFLEGPYRDDSDLILLSQTYINLKQNDKALEVVNKILKKKKRKISSKDLISIADIYSKLNLNDKSEEILDKIDLDMLPLYSVLEMSNIMENNENNNKALELVKYAIDNTNSNDSSFYSIKLKECELLIKQREVDKALDNCYKLLLDNKSDKDKVCIIAGDAYLEKYSYKEAKEYYKSVLISNNKDNKEEAIMKLANLSEICGYNEEACTYFDLLIEENTKYKKEAFFKKVYLNIRKENYSEAYKILNELSEKCVLGEKYMEFRIASVYLKNKLNLEQEEIKGYSYAEKQIMEYDNNACLEHIIEHRKIKNHFNEKINLEDLLKETKEKLTSDNICFGSFFDIYEIDYKNIGIRMDRYRVVVIPNSKDIITMYPIKNNSIKYHKSKLFVEKENKRIAEYNSKKQKLYSKFNVN